MKVGCIVLAFCTAHVIGLAELMVNESKTGIRPAHALLQTSEMVHYTQRDYSYHLCWQNSLAVCQATRWTEWPSQWDNTCPWPQRSQSLCFLWRVTTLSSYQCVPCQFPIQFSTVSFTILWYVSLRETVLWDHHALKISENGLFYYISIMLITVSCGAHLIFMLF